MARRTRHSNRKTRTGNGAARTAEPRPSRSPNGTRHEEEFARTESRVLETTSGDQLLDGGSEEEFELIEFEDSSNQKATIKVVGVGGGGSNALNNMIEKQLQGVEFIAANTDAQALQFSRATQKVQLGAEMTRGLGAGADPNIGRTSALEVRERLRELFVDTDMVFVTAGLGGGTGTGAAPIVAETAREMGALTVGVVTKPFLFEGRVRMQNAERGLDELHQVVDTVITIPNQRLLALVGKNTAVRDAFLLADDVLFNAVRGISDLITIHGLINLDFADVRTIMNEMGAALMGTGTATGDERGVEAARAAISSPLLEDLSIDGARGVLINITGGESLTLYEVNEASTLIQGAAHEEANIIFGAVIDDEMPEDEMRVTVIATGLDHDRVRRGRDTRSDESVANVRHLRRESSVAEPSQPAAERLPVSERFSAPELAEHREARVAPAPPITALDGSDELISPFAEDEYDVPTFIRRNAKGDDEDDEEPAFLRRSVD